MALQNEVRGAMPIATKSLGRLLCAGVAALVGAMGAGCSSDNNNNNGNGGGASPATLVSTCDTICNNLSPCASASLAAQCLNVCNDLNVVPATCLDPFASYLACLAGAKSVSCQAGGQYVLITPPECQSDRQAFVSCNANPSIIAACTQLQTNTSCAGKSVFCVGAPSGCAAPTPNPLGIGTYCCP